LLKVGIKMNINLKGKRALVCGASQGIGEAIAYELASLGAEIILLARSQDKLEKIRAQLPEGKGLTGLNHQILTLDLRDRSKLAEELKLLQKNGPIEILVNNSGGPKAGSLLEANEKDFLEGFENHILAASLIVNHLLPGMREQKYGRIINIISTSVKVPIANLGVSNTIRAAMANWAKTLATEVAPFGVTVNNVLPGYTATPRLDALAKAAADRQGKTEEDIKNMWRASTPLGRFAAPAEIAAAVAFLASPAAAFITGINLPVDGGRTPCL
jgi:3-oxoacyl-[acyl-carrier protein] reductase